MSDKPKSNLGMANGLWIRCDGCGEILYRKSLQQNFFICPRCGFHFRISANVYIDILLDANSFQECDRNLMSANPLEFPNYNEKLSEAQMKSNLNEGFVYGYGTLACIPLVLGVMDFSFMGGSMGSVVGEKVARAIRAARIKCLPLVIVATSGGARMQEGILSLMQMAKTAAELALLAQARLPYIVILTNPTMAGVMASYGSLGDIIIAEPHSLLGFAGARVIEGTIGEKLPEGFQTAEFLLKHGFVDIVISRKLLKSTVSKLLDILLSNKKLNELSIQ